MNWKICSILAAAWLTGCAVTPQKLCAEFAPDTWDYVGLDPKLDQQFSAALPSAPQSQHYWYRSGENQVMACTLDENARDNCSLNLNVFQRMDGVWQQGYSDGKICKVGVTKSSQARTGNDHDELLRLHKEVINAHRQSSAEMLLRNESADYVVAGRGQVTMPTLDERRARLSKYLGSTRFTEYVDVIPPMVMVSPDGKLGWVVVQVRAKGEQDTGSGKVEPVEFESAWIELYRRGADGWKRVGNVSNFKE